MKFLVIDSDTAAIKDAVNALKGLGECDCAHDLLDGVYMVNNCDYDLIITEIRFPKDPSEYALKELGKALECPVVVLSSESSVAEKVEALRSGADDYITKPFDRDELSARVEAVLRRCRGKQRDLYSQDGIELDFKNKMMTIDGKMVKLSLRKYEILEYLIRRRNVIISKERLFNRIWGADQDTVVSVVEVYISELRKLLKSYGKVGHIKTVSGMGYMWQDK